MTTKWVRFRRKRALDARNNTLVRAGESTNRGTGLFADTDFDKGDEICVFTGVVMNKPDDPSEEYSMNWGEGKVLVPEVGTVGGHLANHSCDPNAFVGTPLGTNFCTFIALRRIHKNDEVTIYYGSKTGHDMPCMCGSRFCAGTVGILPESAFGQEVSTSVFDRFTRHARTAVKNRNLNAILAILRIMQDFTLNGEKLSAEAALASFTQIPDLDASDQQWIRKDLLPGLPELFLSPASLCRVAIRMGDCDGQ